jgi:hypothetical protein
MKTSTSIILLFGILITEAVAGVITSYAPAELYFLSTKAPTYFSSDHLTGASYLKFSPDGRYISIAKEHMGVWPVDDGTWNQDSEGTVTLVSTKLCADIVSGSLEIGVGRHDSIGKLSELRRKINEFLTSSHKKTFSEDDLKHLAVGEYSLKVEIDWRAHRTTVTRSEMQSLLKAVDVFLNDPSARNKRLVPLAYKGKIFLVNLNDIVNRDHKEVCKAIDQGKKTRAIVYNGFMISEEQFTKGTGKPYPFKYYPEMNKQTGAE